MSIADLANAMRAHSQMAQGEKTTHRVGQVTAYDPNKYAVRVKFWPDTVESSGWVPLASMYVGAGWGLVAAPTIGDQVIVAFDREDQDAGVVVGRFFTDVEQPPVAQAGEFMLLHKAGSALKFTNDGNVALAVAGNLNATVTGTATVTASGAATVTAPSINLGTAGQTLLSFVTSAFQSLFNSHTHPEHDGGNTSAPNQQMGSSHVTTTVKGA